MKRFVIGALGALAKAGVAAGLMEEGEQEVVLEGDPATAIGFGITVEPAGGSDQPTSDPVALIPFENA